MSPFAPLAAFLLGGGVGMLVGIYLNEWWSKLRIGL